MKLRIQGNALRLRLSPSDLSRLGSTGILEATIHFGHVPGSQLTYGVAHSEAIEGLTVVGTPQGFTVFLPSAEVDDWIATNRVGLSAEVSLGNCGVIGVLLEKDFACLDLSDADNVDTFPNPHLGESC